MRYRQLDDNGDYTLGTGRDFLRDTPETVAQAVMTRLQLWTGEWFVDTADGTPWSTQVLGKYTALVRDGAVRQRILDTPGVKSIDAYSSSVDTETRALSLTATISTVYGSTIITGAV